MHEFPSWWEIKATAFFFTGRPVEASRPTWLRELTTCCTDDSKSVLLMLLIAPFRGGKCSAFQTNFNRSCWSQELLAKLNEPPVPTYPRADTNTKYRFFASASSWNNVGWGTKETLLTSHGNRTCGFLIVVNPKEWNEPYCERADRSDSYLVYQIAWTVEGWVWGDSKHFLQIHLHTFNALLLLCTCVLH